MRPLLFSRPLIKISGEALLGKSQHGIDVETLENIAADIDQIAKRGRKISVVVGGGNIFRGLSGAANGMDRVKADFMGMLATIMNALALEQALARLKQAVSVYSGLPAPAVCETFQRDRAKGDLDAGKIVILAGGTGNPFFTTDTTAALRAAELGCDAILKATQVDGIYSADPKTDPQAQRYDRLTYADVLAQDLKVMDAAAIAIARDNRIPIVVFSLREQGAIGRVLQGEAVCSVVESGPSR